MEFLHFNETPVFVLHLKVIPTFPTSKPFTKCDAICCQKYLLIVDMCWPFLIPYDLKFATSDILLQMMREEGSHVFLKF